MIVAAPLHSGLLTVAMNATYSSGAVLQFPPTPPGLFGTLLGNLTSPVVTCSSSYMRTADIAVVTLSLLAAFR